MLKNKMVQFLNSMKEKKKIEEGTLLIFLNFNIEKEMEKLRKIEKLKPTQVMSTVPLPPPSTSSKLLPF